MATINVDTDADTDAFRNFNAEVEQSRARAIAKYPQLADPNSDMSKKYRDIAIQLFHGQNPVGLPAGGGITPTAATGVIPARVPPPAARIGAGQPDTGRSFVANTPPGSDYNLGTRQYVPQATQGSINGRPATDVLTEGAARTGVSATYSGGAVGTLPRTPQVAGPTPPVGGTQAVLPNRAPSSFASTFDTTGASSFTDREEKPNVAGLPRTPPAQVRSYEDGGEVPNDRVRKFFGGGMPSPTPTPKPNPTPLRGYQTGGRVRGSAIAGLPRVAPNRMAAGYEDGGRVTGEVSLPPVLPRPPQMEHSPVPSVSDSGPPPQPVLYGDGKVTQPVLRWKGNQPYKVSGAKGQELRLQSGGKVRSPKDTVPAMLAPGEVVLNPKQQQKVAVQPNWRAGLNPREQTAMAGMQLPRARPRVGIRQQKAFRPPSKMFSGR